MSAQRNYGIDLLRMLSMFFIVIIHVLGQGGILDSAEIFSVNSSIAWFFEIAAYCAVNCYALISGYVTCDIPFRYSRIVSLWLHVAFYTIIITALFALFSPGTITPEFIFRAVFPVTSTSYWYVTSYFGMFFFIPFFNYLLKTLDRQQLKILVITIALLFSFYATIARRDLFETASGYSMLWLSGLYLMGGYIKKYRIAERFSRKKAAIGYFICILITWICQLGTENVYKDMVGIRRANFLIRYTSPTIFLSAVFLLLLFSQFRFRMRISQKLICFFSPLAFGVYIIHTNPLLWSNILQGAFEHYVQYSPVLFSLSVLGTALAIYLICSVVDGIRYYLFQALNVKKLSDAITRLLSEVIKKILQMVHISL